MAEHVDMHCAISDVIKTGELCYTTSLYDCVALGVRAAKRTERGYYFGHLTSHEYLDRREDKGNAITQLKAFLEEYSTDIEIIAAMNYEQTPDFGVLGGPEVPVNIESHIVNLVARGGRTVSNQGLWLTGGSTVVTFNPAEMAVHGDYPENVSDLNELRNNPNRPYKAWTMPALVRESQRRAASRPRRRSVRARVFSCCTLF
jgi:hypothetical protein